MSDELYNGRVVIMPPVNKAKYIASEGVITFLYELDRNTLRYKKSDDENPKSRKITDVEIKPCDYNPILLLAILSRRVEILSVSPVSTFIHTTSTFIPKNSSPDTIRLNPNIYYTVTLSIIVYNIEYVFHVKMNKHLTLWSLKNAACYEVAGKLLVLFANNLYGDLTRERNNTETAFTYELNMKKTREDLKLLAEVLLEKVPMALHTDHASDLIDLLYNKKVASLGIPGMDVCGVDVESGLSKCRKYSSTWNIYENVSTNSGRVITITHEQLPIIDVLQPPQGNINLAGRRTSSTGDIHERISSPVPLPVPTTPPPQKVPIERFVKNKRGGYRGNYRGRKNN